MSFHQKRKTKNKLIRLRSKRKDFSATPKNQRINSNWAKRTSKLACGFLAVIQNFVGNSKMDLQMGWQDPSVPPAAFAVEDIVVGIDKELSSTGFVVGAVASSFAAVGTAAAVEPSSSSAHLLGVLCCWMLQMGPVVQMDCAQLWHHIRTLHFAFVFASLQYHLHIGYQAIAGQNHHPDPKTRT